MLSRVIYFQTSVFHLDVSLGRKRRVLKLLEASTRKGAFFHWATIFFGRPRQACLTLTHPQALFGSIPVSKPRKFLWNELRNESIKEERSGFRGPKCLGTSRKIPVHNLVFLFSEPQNTSLDRNPKFRAQASQTLVALAMLAPKTGDRCHAVVLVGQAPHWQYSTESGMDVVGTRVPVAGPVGPPHQSKKMSENRRGLSLSQHLLSHEFRSSVCHSSKHSRLGDALQFFVLNAPRVGLRALQHISFPSPVQLGLVSVTGGKTRKTRRTRKIRRSR